MIVTDTNLIIYLTVRDAHSDLADAVLAMDSVWVAPMLWRSEFRNSLVKYVLFRGMTLDLALLTLRAAEDVIGGREFQISSERVLELVMQSKCSAYDCEFVALAQELAVPLVTADKQILKAFPKTAISLEKFAKKK